MKRSIAKTLGMVLITLFVASTAFAGMGGGNLLAIGTKAPDFTFKDIDGKDGVLYEFKKGEPLLLVFLQRTCRSCQREMEYLKGLQETMPELNVLAVFLDAVDRDFQGYKAQYELPFRFAWDAEYEIADQYGVSFTPTSFLLDGSRAISKVYRGWSRKGHTLEDDFKAISK